jgi:gamma-glutamyl-gamma-aminobutyrate hydrolase PuuD
MFENRGFPVTQNVKEADFVQFCGGADVSPVLYNQEMHPSTYNDPHRDREEIELFEYLIDKKVPMTGICRGGQFLNVMAGGTMRQHVDGHAISGTHVAVILETGQMIGVTSTHHQMMQPSEDGHVLMVASESSWYEEYVDGEVFRHEIQERGTDIEAVWYPGINALCYQPHPEYLDSHHECQEYYFDLLTRYIIKD